MAKFILGEKIHMTQVFNADGNVEPVTVLKVAPATITQVKTKDKDGYSAIQIGFGDVREKNVNKAKKGHLKDLGLFRHLKEFRTDEAYTVGDKIEISSFVPGDKVIISSISKSKGFQGVVKRHGFHGGPRSHGQKHSEREPGSISGGTRNGGRVPKGMRMAGRMGGDRITQKGVKIIDVRADLGQIFVRGAVPGRRGTLVEIQSN